MTARAPKNWKDALRIAVGLLMLALGVLGLFLPVLQGILFLLAAGLLLAPYSPWVQRLLDRARRRYPRAFARTRKMRMKLRRRLGTGGNAR